MSRRDAPARLHHGEQDQVTTNATTGQKDENKLFHRVRSTFLGCFSYDAGSLPCLPSACELGNAAKSPSSKHGLCCFSWNQPVLSLFPELFKWYFPPGRVCVQRETGGGFF